MVGLSDGVRRLSVRRDGCAVNIDAHCDNTVRVASKRIDDLSVVASMIKKRVGDIYLSR